jgi:hypothetical protein
MDGRRQGERAAGGGGKKVSDHTFRFLCQDCNMKFKFLNELQVHHLTEHSSKAELVNDDTQPGAPPSFVENPVYGPIRSQFTPYESGKIQNMLDQRIGGPETVILPLIPPPLHPGSPGFFGPFRGIEGKMNSCYFDTFFMLFAFSSAFDGIFTQKALNESIFLRVLLFEIVIPLRTRLFVNRDVVAMLRYFLAEATSNKDYLSNTFDMSEFLMNLMEQIDFGMICNFSGASVTCPLVLDVKHFQVCKFNLQNAMLHAMQVDGISISDQSEAFVTRVRSDFSHPPNCLPQSSVTLGESTYLITAIFCIEKSHYTAFYRLPNQEWVFFDCMRDKEHGHCVPSITQVPDFQNYLDYCCAEQYLSVKSDARSGETRNSFHHCVTKYAYAYVFTRDPVVLPSSGQAVPVLPPRVPMSTVADATKVPISRNHSAGGGAVAVPAQSAQPRRKPSAGGGGAAAVPHQPPPSFGYSQPPCPPRKPAHLSSHIVEYDGSDISGLRSQFALYDAVIPFAKKSESSTSLFKVTNLTLLKGDLEKACDDGVQVFGSFIVSEEGTPEVRFRAVGFQFDDNLVINHEKPVASLSDPEKKKAFVALVNSKWQSFMITAIIFERCT